MHYPIHFIQEDFQKRLSKLKRQFVDSKGQFQKQLKATFYFDKETVIEFPSYQNQWRKEISNKVTVQMTLTSDGQLHYSKPNRKRMQSFFTFPLTQATKVEFKSVQKTKPYTLKKLLSERLEGVWDNLTEDDLKLFIEDVKTISVKDCLYVSDYEEFEEALTLKKPFLSYRLVGNTMYRVEINMDEDGICRAWLFEEDELMEIENTYLILNTEIALFYPPFEHAN